MKHTLGFFIIIIIIILITIFICLEQTFHGYIDLFLLLLILSLSIIAMFIIRFNVENLKF